MDFISIIMSAGKTSVDVALYTLLPIMVVMLIVMKYLEVRGVLDAIVRWLAPLLKPFGLTGMSAFALIQMNFVSFAAPLATLAIMDKRGASDRHMARHAGDAFRHGSRQRFLPVNALRPALAGLYHHFDCRRAVRRRGHLAYRRYRRLSMVENVRADALPEAEQNSQGIIAVINSAGADAIRLALGAVPMLILSLYHRRIYAGGRPD